MNCIEKKSAKLMGPAGGAYSAPKDPLAGGEGASPHEPKPLLAALRASNMSPFHHLPPPPNSTV